jgi:hypothetical protein
MDELTSCNPQGTWRAGQLHSVDKSYNQRFTKPEVKEAKQEPMEKDHVGGQVLHTVVAPDM